MKKLHFDLTVWICAAVFTCGLFLLSALPLAAQQAPEPTPEQLKQVATIMRQQRDALSHATAGGPAYTEGSVYYDTTLHKFRVGGAVGWETITSV